MPTFDIVGNLARPLGEKLMADARFAGVKIFFDRSENEEVPVGQPVIDYFFEGAWEDMARGSSGYSLQTRRMTATVAFLVQVFDMDKEKAAIASSEIAGNILDFLRENREFDRTKGIFVQDRITWDATHNAEERGFIWVQKISAPFEFFSGAGV